MVRTVLLCGLVLTLRAQQGGEELLAHVRAKVRDTIDRLSNYMCTEAVERTVYVLPATGKSAESCAGLLSGKSRGRLLSSDRLRFDVGVSKSVEMYSWAGENRFHDRTPGEIVGRGATSNGAFAALLSMIFTADPVKFSYRGEIMEAERPLAEFAFGVSGGVSRYRFTGRFRVVTAYEGTFLVDPKTFDLVRLTIRTEGLPREVGACQVTTTLDYQNVRLNDSNLLLPSVARMEIVETDGSEKINEAVFSSCHEFLGESVVKFGDSADAPPSNAPVPAQEELAVAKDLSFEVELKQDIDTSTAAAGDAIRCELVTPILNDRKVVAPAGTPVSARIVELSRIYARNPSVVLAFRLESADLGGTVRTFAARAKGTPLGPAARPAPGLQIRTSGDREARIVFSDPRGNMVIKSGLKTKWLTGL